MITQAVTIKAITISGQNNMGAWWKMTVSSVITIQAINI